MRVYVYPADLTGCGYYRLIWPAKVLQKAGHDVRLIHPETKTKISGGVDENGKLTMIKIPSDADVMVFQRVTSKMIIDGIDIMRKNGVAVVLDVDDDMSAIHPSNPAFAALSPNGGATTQEYDWNAARAACDRATMVTVSSDALLKRYAVHGRGRILYNGIPEVMTQIPHQEAMRTIGWGGSMHSHPDDPQVVGTAMTKLQREGYAFKIVGPPRGTKEAFKLDREAMTTGPLAIEDYPHAITQLAVGIAPLNSTRFNQAKSWLKMLEYAALGVPCIGSPTDEYRRIHSLGIGLIAQSPRDWYRHAKLLLDNDIRRGEMSARGREIVQQLTIERNAWRWWEAWSDALAIERGPMGIKPAVSRIPTTA